MKPTPKKPNRPKPAKKAAVGRVMWHNHNDPSGPVINGSNYGNPKSRPVLVIDLFNALNCKPAKIQHSNNS